jgi:hypothetical protein
MWREEAPSPRARTLSPRVSPLSSRHSRPCPELDVSESWDKPSPISASPVDGDAADLHSSTQVPQQKRSERFPPSYRSLLHKWWTGRPQTTQGSVAVSSGQEQSGLAHFIVRRRSNQARRVLEQLENCRMRAKLICESTSTEEHGMRAGRKHTRAVLCDEPLAVGRLIVYSGVLFTTGGDCRLYCAHTAAWLGSNRCSDVPSAVAGECNQKVIRC